MNFYKNVVLTVIATAVTALVLENAIVPAHLASGITKVAICDPSSPEICATVGEAIREHGTNTYRLLIRTL